MSAGKIAGTDPRQQATADLKRSDGYTITREGSVLLARRDNDYQLISIDGTCKRAIGARK
jgi:hypothetical protein